MTKTNEWDEEELHTKPIAVAECPRCGLPLYANSVQSLLDDAYQHFVDAHVVGGSFD